VSKSRKVVVSTFGGSETDDDDDDDDGDDGDDDDGDDVGGEEEKEDGEDEGWVPVLMTVALGRPPTAAWEVAQLMWSASPPPDCACVQPF
jgi:hypothetical protein